MATTSHINFNNEYALINKAAKVRRTWTVSDANFDGDATAIFKVYQFNGIHALMNFHLYWDEADTNVSPSGTASLVYTDGTTDHFLLTDFDLGAAGAESLESNLAFGFSAWHGARKGGSSGDWWIEIRLTADAATWDPDADFILVLDVADEVG